MCHAMCIFTWPEMPHALTLSMFYARTCLACLTLLFLPLASKLWFFYEELQ